MSDDSPDHRREDDSLLRKVAVGVLVTVVIQAGGWIYMIGSLGNQVANNTKSIDAFSELLIKKQNETVSIARTQVLVEGLTITVNRMVDGLDRVALEQNARTPVIDRVKRYLDTEDRLRENQTTK